jgi:beta-aspartyl-peptidase (threonine type)
MNAAIGAIDYLHRRVEGYGGVIMISPQGEYGFAHNTPRMAYAFADEDGKAHAAIQITDN